METQTNYHTLHKALIKGLNQLPQDDLPRCLNLINIQLNKLFQAKLTPFQSFQLLELLFPMLKNIGAQNQQYYLAKPKRRAIHLNQFYYCQTLLLQLALHYGAIINQTLLADNLPSIQTLQSQSLYRAMDLLLCIQHHCYQMYCAFPAHLWSCLHQFYFISEKKHLLHSQSIFPNEPTTVTLDNLYKQSLLLATAQLNKIPQHNLTEIFTQITHWANLITLSKNYTQDNYYHIHLDIDAPPFYTSLEQGKMDPSTTRFFHCQGIITQLTNTKTHNHLKKVWQGFHIRQQHRLTTHGFIPVIHGFNNIYKKLTHQISPSEEPWQVINSSPKGFCLQNEPKPHFTMNAETLILFQIPALVNLNLWSIGIIRWLKRSLDNPICIGVEMLGDSVLPVKIQQNNQKALLLLGSLVNKQPNTIILPTPTTIQLNSTITVIHPRLSLTIQLTHQWDQLINAQQFTYELLTTHTNLMGWSHVSVDMIDNEDLS